MSENCEMTLGFWGGLLAALLLWVTLSEAANLTFAWDAATDDVAVTGYRIYYRIAPAAYILANSQDMGNTLTGTVTGLTANTLYYFCVTAHDGDTPTPNESSCSQETGMMTGPTVPTAPTGLVDAGHTCQQVRLRWERSFDDLAVTEYRVRRDNVQIGTTTGTTRVYDDRTVSPNVTYTYHVRAADVVPNESGNSNAVVMTTPACP
jgi:chitinase